MQLMEREGEAKGALLEHMCGFWESQDLQPPGYCYEGVAASRGLVRSFLFHFGKA